MHISRRGLLAGAAAVAAAGPGFAAGASKSVEAGKVFPYLEAYLKLPAPERSRFLLAYYLTAGGRGAQGLKAWLADADGRTALPIGPRGRVERLPTLAQLRSKARIELEVPPSTRFDLVFAVEPSLRPDRELDAAELAAAVAQAARGARKAAGIAGFAAPRFDRVAFLDAAGAQAVWADGRARTLPVANGAPVFEPAAHPGAATVRFATPPQQMVILPQ